mmetsp:Transcript_675/g.2123  ORF Transcript_675/g.2123 Transcript_675/m.2123 type:complete len:837 (+) Transcript_675:95-2605(+)
MAGIIAALSLAPEADACRQLCIEVLGAARRWGPAEQRALFERLPLLLHRLYVWLGLSNAGIEEALLRTFHPAGPLMAHLATWETPAFVFPLHRLPPRAFRAAVLSVTDGRGAGTEGFAQALRPRRSEDFGSALFGLLGVGRLARSPAGGIEGVTLTALEFTLMCLVHYLVCDLPGAAQPIGRSPAAGGAFSSSGPPGPASGAGSGGPAGMAGSSGSGDPILGGLGGSSGINGLAGTGSAASLNASSWAPVGTGSGAFGGPSSRGLRPPGSLSPAFERLLLAHLQVHLQHSEYELAYAHEPRAARFLLYLLHEFLIAPQPATEVLPASLRYDASVTHDPRIQPAALHAARLVALHVLANPALRRGCEEALGVANSSRAARVTREVALLGPPLVDLVSELLRRLAMQKQAGLETLTSLMRLWLVLCQPWKAKRLHEWYLVVRPSEPRLEPPAPAVSPSLVTTARQNQLTDVALLGLEPETLPGVPEAPLPSMSQGVGVGLEMPANSANAALALPLLPGEGDAQSWRSYVAKFQGAYCLLEAFLTTPLHAELCYKLCVHVAGLGTIDTLRGAHRPRIAAAVEGSDPAVAGAPGGAAPPLSALAAGTSTPWVAAPPLTATQLLRQRHVIVALKALAQAMLCFSEPQLLGVLAALPPDGGGCAPPATPLLAEDGSLRPQVALAAKAVWAALLAASTNQELQPLLAAVSRQLQHAPQWVPLRLPLLERSELHRPFALEVVEELGRQSHEALGSPKPMPSSGASPPSAAAFVGSEWQRPVRGGEAELLLQLAYWLASLVDQMLGRQPRSVTCGYVPQTEWPRLFANWKLTGSVALALFVALLW